ncbi:hypothetical protein Hanom_Chr12g01103941 [Helianthus anomalus]
MQVNNPDCKPFYDGRCVTDTDCYQGCKNRGGRNGACDYGKVRTRIPVCKCLVCKKK